MVARHENAHLAERLITATCRKQGIAPHQLTIHADRGAPMRSKLVALLFSDRSGHRRQSFAAPREQRQPVLRNAVPDREVPPGVSWPVRLARTRARRQPRSFRVVQRRAPSQRPELSDTRRRALRPCRNGHRGPAPHASGRVRRPSERFVNGPPRPETLPTAVWINRPPKPTREDAPGATPVTPDDPQHGVDPY